MPSFYIASKLFARIVDTIVVVLVMNRSCQAVAKHAFSKGWELVGIIFEEECGGA